MPFPIGVPLVPRVYPQAFSRYSALSPKYRTHSHTHTDTNAVVNLTIRPYPEGCSVQVRSHKSGTKRFLVHIVA